MKLKEIHIKGFKSIDNHKGQTIPLGDVTVLLGANGSGKSNVISFFEMLNAMLIEKFANFIQKNDINTLFYFGLKKTENISFSLKFENDYSYFLFDVDAKYGNNENIFIDKENILFYDKKTLSNVISKTFNGEKELSIKKYFTGNEVYLETLIKGISKKSEELLKENKKINSDENFSESLSHLKNDIDLTVEAIENIVKSLVSIRSYQFHDTSDTSSMKYRSYIDDASFLRVDAKNIASFLKMLKESEKYNKYYQRIVRRIQQIMPQFDDFSLETLPPHEEYTKLNWYEKNNSEYLFSPHQISDGSLRFMALATLLLQPPDLLPSLIVIDEPELGLHPAAIAELAAMIRSASAKTQVLIATQSTLLVDEFSLENVVVVERDKENNCSIFKKLNEEQYATWLAEYSLSELWEKNVLGGKP